MASQISPGVIVKERDLTTGTVVNAASNTAAVVSTFQKGPVGQITTIASQRELVDTFGSPGDSNADDFFVASEFLNYGGRLSVVRAETGAVNAGAAAIIRNKVDYESRIEGTTPAWKWAAQSPGIWGNDFDVVVADRGADQYVTFASAPAGIAAGTDLTFSSGKAAEVLSWDAGSLTGAVILNDPTSRVTSSDTLDTPDTGRVSGVTVNNAGTGYTTATALATTGGSGSTAKVDIVVTTGNPENLTVSAGGSTYGATGTAVATSGGNGSGLTLDFTSTGGVIDSVSVAVAGDGQYQVNDVVTITGGGNNAQVTITSVRGAITSVAITGGDPGIGYAVGDTLAVTQSGGSSGTVDVSAVQDTTIAVTVEDWWTNTNTDGTKSGADDGKIKLSAIGPRPGTSAYAANLGLSYDEVHIGVIERSTKSVVERLQYLSKFSDGKTSEGASSYYPTYVKEVSNYVFFGDHVTAAHNPTTAGAGLAAGTAASAGTSGQKLQLFGVVNTSLASGTDDYAYTTAEFSTGLQEFNDTETVDVDFILMGGSMATEADSKLKASACITTANLRKDAIAFVSAHKGAQVSGTVALSRKDQKDNTVNFFSTLTSSSYAVFDSGYKYFYDRFNDKYRYVPTNGDVAGLCVATSSTLDDWFSPAGLTRGGVRNAIKLAYNPTSADRDELYQNRINPVVSFPGQGITLFGDKTALSSPSAFDRINVRRLFINIEERAEALAKAVIFEQNDETTRSGFNNALSSYLSEVQARRGISDFLVVCDESNNTSSVIDRNEFVAEVYIKPTRSINFITLSFVATRSGVSFSEVVGRS
tara:strand:+ start:801 stop:3242 length:2442 start_codon:yes stop_codon:yes gene_type:complete